MGMATKNWKKKIKEEGREQEYETVITYSYTQRTTKEDLQHEIEDKQKEIQRLQSEIEELEADLKEINKLEGCE